MFSLTFFGDWVTPEVRIAFLEKCCQEPESIRIEKYLALLHIFRGRLHGQVFGKGRSPGNLGSGYGKRLPHHDKSGLAMTIRKRLRMTGIEESRPR